MLFRVLSCLFVLNLYALDPSKVISGLTGPNINSKTDIVRTLRFATDRAYRVKQNDFEPEMPLDKKASGILSTGEVSVLVRRSRHKRVDVNNPEARDGKRTFEVQNINKRNQIIDDLCPSVVDLAALANENNTPDKKDLLVYIHGFNNSFNDAAIRAAQLQLDIGWSNMMVLSWYSADNLAYYSTNDMNAIKYSPITLAPVIEELRRCWFGNVHFIVHSKGNGFFLESMSRIASPEESETQKMGRVIMAAPDVSVEWMQNAVPVLLPFFQKIIHYYSSKDRASRLSEFKHKDIRAGANPVNVQGLESISVDQVNIADFKGHSYYANSIAVVEDIKRILTLPLEQIQSPSARNAPIRMNKSGYFEFIAPPMGSSR